MKGILVGTAILLIGFSTIATSATNKPIESKSDNSAWLRVTSSDDMTFSARKGSFEITQRKDGADVGSILGQYTFKKSNIVIVYKLYVSKSDCSAGYGKLVLLNTDGNYFSESDFVSKGDNVASGIADFICAVYQATLEKQNDKSL